MGYVIWNFVTALMANEEYLRAQRNSHPMNLNDEAAKAKAQEIMKIAIANVSHNPSIIKGNGCAACHVLFTMKDKMEVSEQDAADLLSEVLLENQALNDEFINLVENVHMRARYMGTTFVIKDREAKDRYIESNFKNILAELLSDSAGYGTEIVLRKLILSHIALSVAQNLGIDYHAATEELYYYMRKYDQETDTEVLSLISSIMSRGRQR
ncbi:MAG: hypothetical protein ACREAZ_10025 [Nitrososphaera sp.]